MITTSHNMQSLTSMLTPAYYCHSNTCQKQVVRRVLSGYGMEPEIPFILASICGIRYPPDRTFLKDVIRIPAFSTHSIKDEEITISSIKDFEKLIPSSSLDDFIAALTEDISLLSGKIYLADDATIAAKVLGCLMRENGICYHPLPLYARNKFDKFWLNAPLSRYMLRSFLLEHQDSDFTVVAPYHLQDLVSIDPSELNEFIKAQVSYDINGSELHVIQKDIKKWYHWDKSVDPIIEEHNGIVPPSWLKNESLAMLHTGLIASVVGWKPWLEGHSSHIASILWSLLDPSLDELVLDPKVHIPGRQPKVIRAAAELPVNLRGKLQDGLFFNAWPLCKLAGEQASVIDEHSLARVDANRWLSKNTETLLSALKTGWLAQKGWLDFEELKKTLANPFSRSEFALHLINTLEVDSWLLAHTKHGLSQTESESPISNVGGMYSSILTV